MRMDNEIIVMGAFLGTGLLAYVIIPGLLVMWDRSSTTWNHRITGSHKVGKNEVLRNVEGRRPETQEERSSSKGDNDPK